MMWAQFPAGQVAHRATQREFVPRKPLRELSLPSAGGAGTGCGLEPPLLTLHLDSQAGTAPRPRQSEKAAVKPFSPPRK